MNKKSKIISSVIALGLGTLLLACASTRKQESPGEYIDDSVITTNVKAAIVNEPSLKSYQIGVETYKGVVQLSGFVDFSENVSKAGEVTAKVSNVKSVKNDLIVK